MVTLGELELLIRDAGGDDVLRKLGLIDSTGARVGGKPIAVSIAAPNAKLVTEAIADLTKATTVATTATQQGAAANEQAAAAERDAAAATKERARALNELERAQQAAGRAATLADPNTRIRDAGVTAPTLGPALPSTTTRSAAAASEAVRAAEAFKAETAAIAARTAAAAQSIPVTEADIAAYNEWVASLIAGARLEDTRAEAIASLIPLEEAFTQALQAGNLPLEQRVTLAEELARVQKAIASGINLPRVAAPIGPELGPGTRAAQAAFAAPALGPGLPGMTTEKAAAMSAAIGKTTQSFSLFGKEVTKADGNLSSFSKRGLSSLNILAFGFSQFAATGETSLRTLVQATTGVLSFLGTKGAIASLIATATLGISDAIFGFVNSARAKQRADILADAKAELTIRKAKIEEGAAGDKFAFDQGLSALRQYYAQRAAVIDAQTSAEVAARKKQIDALNIRVASITSVTGIGRDKDREEALRSIKQLEAEIVAIQLGGQTQRKQNENELLTTERALANQILEFEHKRMDAQGLTHETRLDQIHQEAEAFSRVPLHVGETAEGRAEAVKAFERALTLQAEFEERERRIGLLTAEFGRRRTELQAKVQQGQLSESDMEAQLAAEQRQQLPTLEKLADDMERFARELKNPELIAAVRQFRSDFASMGINAADLRARVGRSIQEALSLGGPSARSAAAQIRDELAKAIGPIPLTFVIRSEALLAAAGSVDQQFQGLGIGIGRTFGDALAGGMAAALTKGSGKNFFEAFGNIVLQGLGNIFVQMGSELLVYGLIMSGLLPFLANPFTSGPAAIAAGAALIAAGAALGAIATNNSGSRTGGGSSSVTFGPRNDDITQRILLDPDRNRRQQQEPTTVTTRADPRPEKAMRPIAVYVGPNIGVNDPVAQGQLVAMVNAGIRAGYRID